MLIYFGYTWCPDFCPMSLSTMVQALDLLGPEEAEQVVPVMITIDPERDTVGQLAEYVPLFSPAPGRADRHARADRRRRQGVPGLLRQG